MQKGFSLVELSIVLVILGLLTGGILAGQSLIRASELRAITTEFQRYVSATHSFRDKYMALPGDMLNATNFWGVMTNCAAASPSGTGTQTCNGNGSGGLNNPTHASRTGEIFGFWQHLANAGLVEGNYTGIAGSGSPTDTLLGSNSNSPSSRISTAGWTAFAASYTGNGTFTDANYANNLLFGGDDSASHTYRPVLKPEETWSLDTKLDDGKPQHGKLWAIWWDTCTTAANSADLSGEYDLSLSTQSCALAFRDVF